MDASVAALEAACASASVADLNTSLSRLVTQLHAASVPPSPSTLVPALTHASRFLVPLATTLEAVRALIVCVGLLCALKEEHEATLLSLAPLLLSHRPALSALAHTVPVPLAVAAVQLSLTIQSADGLLAVAEESPAALGAALATVVARLPSLPPFLVDALMQSRLLTNAVLAAFVKHLPARSLLAPSLTPWWHRALLTHPLLLSHNPRGVLAIPSLTPALIRHFTISILTSPSPLATALSALELPEPLGHYARIFALRGHLATSSTASELSETTTAQSLAKLDTVPLRSALRLLTEMAAVPMRHLPLFLRALPASHERVVCFQLVHVLTQCLLHPAMSRSHPLVQRLVRAVVANPSIRPLTLSLLQDALCSKGIFKNTFLPYRLCPPNLFQHSYSLLPLTHPDAYTSREVAAAQNRIVALLRAFALSGDIPLVATLLTTLLNSGHGSPHADFYSDLLPLKSTWARDIYLEQLLHQCPSLWSLLEIVAEAEFARVWENVQALLALAIARWASPHAPPTRTDLRATQRLLRLLLRTQVLPPIFRFIPSMINHLPPRDVAHLLHELVWAYLEAAPPLNPQAPRPPIGPYARLIRLLLVRHAQKLGRLYLVFLTAMKQ